MRRQTVVTKVVTESTAKTGSDPSELRSISHLVVLGHPSKSSFSAAIAERYVATIQANHHDAVIRDLYDLGFDPCLKEAERLSDRDEPLSPDVAAELNYLRRCDVVTFVYPLWFGMPPAMIKGYIDRVFGAGFRLNDLKKSDGRLFQGKRLAVMSTSASSLPWLEAQGMWISLRKSFENYLQTVFGFVESYHYHAASIVDNLDPVEAERVLYEVGELARDICAKTAMALRVERSSK